MKPTTLLQLGLILSLGVTLVGFEYATVDIKREKVTTSKMEAVEDEFVTDDFEIKKPEVPVENRTQTNNTQQTNLQNTTTATTNTNNIQTTTNVNLVTNTGGLPGDSVVIVDFGGGGTVVQDFFDIVEDMPTYESLLTITDKSKRRSETDLLMMKNVLKNVKYPEMARQTGIQGKVYVQFIVSNEGEITNVTIMRSVHPDLDSEAIRAVKTLPKMIPGKQLDKAVNVRFTIPIDFKLKN